MSLPVPLPIIIADEDWPTFAKHETNAAYERYGIVPGAFVDTDTHRLYGSASWARGVFTFQRPKERKLGEHECGHDWDTPGEEHPTTIRLGTQHAAKCGFDTRAFTWLLRWRWNKAIHQRYLEWEKAWAEKWKKGELVIQRAAEVP